MNAQELAQMFVDRMGEWKLHWEVLWMFFQFLLDRTELNESNIEEMLNGALLEWDI